MPYRFAVVCEAKADYEIATQLAERIIAEHVEWMDDGQFQNCPIWFPLNDQTPFLKWTDIKDLALREGIPPLRAGFEGRRGAGDALNARRALQLFKKWHLRGRPIDGVLFIRDEDGDPARRTSLDQARDAEGTTPTSVDVFEGRDVIGVARPMREGWVLAGFIPRPGQEEHQLASIRAELTFDPTREPDRLRGKAGESRNAKRVLAWLTQEKPEREAACWRDADLSLLRERGEASGLAAFLAEVEDRLVPRFTGRPFERPEQPAS